MSQLTRDNNRQLFQILIAIAWIDGEVQSQEKKYLHEIAREQGLGTEAEIQELLSNTQPTSNTECYRLLEQYLGANPSLEDYHNLLSAISTLVYSDGDIATEEAELLTQIQELEPNNSSNNSIFEQLLSKIQKLYKSSLRAI